MRKIYKFLLTGVFMALAVTAIGQGVGVTMTATAPTIDGDVSDAAWDAASSMAVENVSSGTMDAAFAASSKMLWDADNLYVAISVADDTLTNDNWPSELKQDDNDYIDLYIDMDRLFPDGSGWHSYDANDFQIKFLRDADLLEIGGQNSTVSVAESGITYGQMEEADGSGWMLEVQIPLANLDANFTAEHNARLGFEIMVGDADADTIRDGRVAWNMAAGVDRAWADPKLWGVLVMSDGSAISLPATSPEIMTTAAAPVIDGTIDALWNSVDFREINNTTSGAMDDTFDAEFKAVWDATNLYLLVEVQDDVLKNDNWPSELKQDDNDYIDIYLDTDMEFTEVKNGWHYYDNNDFQIKLLRDVDFLEIGGQNSTVSVAASGITYAQAEVTGGWLAEVSIPWANMDPSLTPVHDTPIGLEVMVGDADTDTVRNGRNAWFMTADRAWELPLLWGTVILSDGSEITSKVLSLENELISTSIGEIDAGSIIEIPQSTTAAELVAAVSVSAGATSEVHDGSGVVAGETEIAESGMTLKILSEKGFWNYVKLVLEAIPTGLLEDFNDPSVVDTSIWFTGYLPAFEVSIADDALVYDMAQENFPDGIHWEVGMLNLVENPRISLDIKIEDATWDDGTGAAPALKLPVQISLFSPNPAGGDTIRAGNFTIDVPAAALDAGTFETYYFDMTQGDAWDADASPALIDTVYWILFETVKWPGTHDATIYLDNIGIGDQALTPPLPSKTGYTEDFNGDIDMEIWDANKKEHDDGTRVFTVSEDNDALKVEMSQAHFADGLHPGFTKEEWVLDVSDPDHQVVTMKIKVEDATYDGVAIPTLPFQVSFFAQVPDPAVDASTNTRVGQVELQIPVAAAGEGEFVEYYFDFKTDIASKGHTHGPEKVVSSILMESVRWDGWHKATYWLDDVIIGSDVVPYVPSDDATIHSTLYGTLGTGEITMVDPNTSVTAFKLGLTVEENATLVILDGSGGSEVTNPDRTDVATGMVVVVTAEDGTTMEYSITTGPTGINTLNAESIEVYPNPASEVLNISNTAAFERIMIANITGQTIEVIDVTSNSLVLDVSDYDAGLYILNLESAEYGNVIKKFIIK